MTQPTAVVEHGGAGETKDSPTHRRRWLDCIAIVLLIGVIASSWCHGQRMWSRADWQTPLIYKGPYAVRDRSDILIYSGFIRAARDGHFAPFGAKFIPELGAPFDGNWNDWPYLEYVPLYLIGVVARGVGIFAALNITLIACNLLAGLAFYFVARYRKVDVTWSFTAALAFGLAPFIFMHSPDHPMVAFCWYVPLMVLVLSWLVDDVGIVFGSQRFWAAIGLAFMFGLFNPYFFVTFCQLVLLTAGALFFRTRNAKLFGTALCLVASTFSAFIIINLGPWLWQVRLGRNHGSVVRQFQWLEIYALKALDLVTPPSNHQWTAFREFAQWRASVALMHDEGSYIGIIGVAALLFIIGTAIRRALNRDAKPIPVGALWILWIFLYYSTGGLNAIVGALGFTYLRAGCRLSLFIFAISLLFAAEWISRKQLGPVKAIALATICCLVIFVDQVPIPPSPEEKAEIAQQVSSDETFVRDLENVLPPGAMVFQLPVMDFPESPMRTESSYDQLRPYLFSRHLRWSFGSMKGRPREQWQHEVEKLSLPESMAEIKRRGFSALYVSRIGYPNNARDLEENLRLLGYDQEIENSDRDLFCFILK